MNSRTKARVRALEVLFEAEERHEDTLEVLRRRRLHTSALISDYSERIVQGVVERDEEIREYIETYSKGWAMDRMPSVDRALLRMGVWELLYNDDVPDAVAVAEATGLARTHSTDDSPRFINGVLGRLQKVKPTLMTD
ncbi:MULTISPECIES: transcription antitermination factor NusB [Kocuria]|uniref:transcription antitermination factor NusB n=1 Tax=Kocuria TaxID=57493 RepID=UPI00065F91F9|nr:MULTISPECIES: transcription antitermination factor NusB [Kocuria]MCT1366760.1 transcription antitermination factor NusB [Rothia sp. p3-SID1597]RUQ22650.1 transcription antitermination factor NusB [Kocuria sp. HSID16901]